jgi:hypothetical protein
MFHFVKKWVDSADTLNKSGKNCLQGVFFMRLNSSNYNQVLRLFNEENQQRIRDKNTRIQNEWAISWKNPAIPPRMTELLNIANNGGAMHLSFEDQMEMMNPNFIRGLVTVHGGAPPDRRIIDIPEGAREAIIAYTRHSFANNFFGMSSCQRDLTMIRHSFLRQIPEQDRQAAHWTMTQVFSQEADRIVAAVRQAIPNWQNGQRVSDDILIPILNYGAGSINVTA